MNEVSDKTLVVLIIIAIVISFSGTLVSLNRLSQLGIPITGMAGSGTGVANLTIIAGTSIAVSQNIIFGAGSVNTSYAVLESNASNYMATNGTGTWNWTAYGGQAFVIENDGNTNVSINITTNVSKAKYIGGANPFLGAAISYEEGDAACQGVGSGAVQITVWKEINDTSNVTICRNLTPTDASDQINISLRLGIPEDAPTGTGEKRCTVTFYGYTGEDV